MVRTNFSSIFPCESGSYFKELSFTGINAGTSRVTCHGMVVRTTVQASDRYDAIVGNGDFGPMAGQKIRIIYSDYRHMNTYNNGKFMVNLIIFVLKTILVN